jgi:glyoxylase I family protein
MAITIQDGVTLLQVFDMPSAIKFYCDVLGFEIVSTSEILPNGSFHWAMLQLTGVQLMLNTAYESNDERPAATEPDRLAAHGDTIIYFRCPDVDAAYNHLRSLGVNVKPPSVAYYGMKQLYVSDPDGFELCFQWPANS